MSELSRLRWRCRRGMKELDVLFENYLDRHYAQADDAERAAFQAVVEMDDPDIYAICLRRMPAPPQVSVIFERFREAL